MTKLLYFLALVTFLFYDTKRNESKYVKLYSKFPSITSLHDSH